MFLDTFEEFEDFSNFYENSLIIRIIYLLKSLLKVSITYCIINEIKNYVKLLSQLPGREKRRNTAGFPARVYAAAPEELKESAASA